jgi:signal transduction histidine kinase/ligand-binding sensor domain-containing protein
VTGLYEDSKGSLWAGVLNGLWQWKPGPPKFYAVPGELSGIQGFAEGVDGTLVVGTRAGIRQFVRGKIEAYPVPGVARQFETQRLLRDRDGGFWIGTMKHGLMHIHQGRTDVFGQPNGLTGDNIQAIFEDREGNIWIATANGLDRFRDFAVPTFSVNEGLSNGIVGSVLADRDGGVWLSTFGGLDRWNNGQVTTYDGRKGKVNGLDPDSLFQDSRGRIWVSTQREFGYLENNRFSPVSRVPGGTVHGIAEDSEGNLWIANQNHGLFHLFARGKVEEIPWEKLGHKDFAWSIAVDPLHDGLWLGFLNGGVIYFTEGQNRVSYSGADGLGEGSVSRFRFDRDGTVWAATQGGLSRLKSGRIATLTSKNGLPCDAVHWVIQDNDHAFWLLMSCALVRIARSEVDAWAATADKDNDTKRTIQATVFDSSDGVRSSGYPPGCTPHVTRSSDGKLWFTTLDGVSVIDPQHLPFNKVPPPVHIAQIKADRKVYDVNSAAGGALQLPSLVRDLTIDYTALSLTIPEKVHFRFKLEGQDSDWREVVNDRQVQYSNLPPRNYRFRVMACNNSGVWNEEGAALNFAIAPAYYQTTWFRLSCVAAFLALLWAVYQLRLRQLAREYNMRLDERVNERTRIARELHDTLLQSFQGLVIRFQAARNQLPHRPEEASEALDSALVSADRALEEGRSSIQELRSELLKKSNIEQMLLAMGKELVSSQNGEYSSPPLRVIVEGTRRAMRAMITEEIYRIARELLRNTYRHAHARSIEAELRYDDDAFVLIVRDDGKGIDPIVLKGRGRAGHWGLPGAYERAEGIGARLDIWSEAGAGTEVRLTVPGAIAYEKSSHGGRFRLFRKTRIYEHGP